MNSALSGEGLAAAAAWLNSLNSGVSGMLLRTHRPTPTNAMLQMNGMRQPPASMKSLPLMVSRYTVNEDSSKPRFRPSAGQAPWLPRLPSDACS